MLKIIWRTLTKRSLTILTILLLPLPVWAMTAVKDIDLSNVTGQAGLNITVDVLMNASIKIMAWGDSDGINNTTSYNPWTVPAASSGGYIGIANFNLTNLTVEERTDSSDNYNGYNTTMLKPITIDVATVNTAWTITTTPSWGVPGVTQNIPADTTIVQVGLGALEISAASMKMDVNLYQRANGVATNNIALDTAQNLGDVELGGLSMYFNPRSYVDIYSPASAGGANPSGIQFAVNVTIDKFDLTYLGWSDEDGIKNPIVAGTRSGKGINKVAANDWMNDNAPGYIGITSLNVGTIAINGTAGIGVNTSAKGLYAQLPALLNLMSGATVNGYAVPSQFYTSESTFELALKGVGFSQYNGSISGNTIITSGTIANGQPLNALSRDLLYSDLGLSTTINPVSVAEISFPTEFLIDVEGTVTAAVQLSNVSNFAAGPGTTTLGDIYLSHLGIDIHAGSWVDIWAH